MKTPTALLGERGRRIRQLRQENSLTQRELADTLKLHREAIAEIEAGRRDLSLYEGALLASALGCVVQWLYGYGRSERRR